MTKKKIDVEIIKQKAKQCNDDIVAYTKENPWAAIGISAGIGALVGAAIVALTKK